MPRRPLHAAAVTTAALLCLAGGTGVALATASTAVAAPAAPSPSSASPAATRLPAGLYGDKDPTYDAVWRQSIALLAQDTVGVTPAGKAVDWLMGQQCSSGAYAAYRADTARPCDAKTPVDSNSTAAAVQALAALGDGHRPQVQRSVGWLRSMQNRDGGWGFNPGSPSDANSTSVVIGALTAAGQDPDKVASRSGRSAYDALLHFQLGCGAKPEAEQGAFGYQPDKKGRLTANADATAAAALAGLGKGMVVKPSPAGDNEDVVPLDCGAADSKDAREPDEAAGGAAAYLAALVKKDGHLNALAPGADKPAPDYANTAETVLALAAGGHRDAAEPALKWLQANSAGWAKNNPAGLGTLVLTAYAMGADPTHFGGADLVRQLNATGPKPAAVHPAKARGADAQQAESGDDGNATVWWIVGAGLAAGAGIGFALTARKKT